MRRLCGDLALLAAVGQVYGCGEAAQNLYSLAQYGCNLSLAMDPGDVDVGLGLIGLDAFRLVAPGQSIPQMIPFALGEGHVVLAQIRPDPRARADRWVCLFDAEGDTWRGIVTGWDLVAQGISSSLGWKLTGHYVIVSTPMPGWAADPPS